MNKEKLIELYQCMLKIRLAEERIAGIYPSDKIQSPVHLSVGQEAVAAGVSQALERTDHLYGTYRSHGLFIAKGGKLTELFAELYAKETGCSRGRGGSMHLTAPEVGLMGTSSIVASTIPAATGDALASSLQGRRRMVVSLFGDGAVEEGIFFESINFALLKNLPIVYVCENNDYAIHSKVADRRKQTELFRVGEGLGLEGRRFDGNDAAEVYMQTREAVQKVREGGAPVFLEFMTYRWYEHVGPNKDHNEAYRDQKKLKEALARDPLLIAGERLREAFKVSPEMMEHWKNQIQSEIDEAVEFAEKSPAPAPETLHPFTWRS